MATHSSILAWKIPWTEEPGRYSPWGQKESDMIEQLSTQYVLCASPRDTVVNKLYPCPQGIS